MKKSNSKQIPENIKALGKLRFISMNVTTSVLVALPIYLALKYFLKLEPLTLNIWTDIFFLIVLISISSIFSSKRHWEKHVEPK